MYKPAKYSLYVGENYTVVKRQDVDEIAGVLEELSVAPGLPVITGSQRLGRKTFHNFKIDIQESRAVKSARGTFLHFVLWFLEDLVSTILQKRSCTSKQEIRSECPWSLLPPSAVYLAVTKNSNVEIGEGVYGYIIQCDGKIS